MFLSCLKAPKKFNSTFQVFFIVCLGVYLGVPTNFDAEFSLERVDKEFFGVGTLMIGSIVTPLLIVSQIFNGGRSNKTYFVSIYI